MRVAGWVGRRLLPLTVAAGDGALAVSWAAPAIPGSAAITAYGIRYILTSADETDDANWSVVEDIWTGAGSLAYTLIDLSNAAQHDVQVRAASSAGDGHWSPTTAATPPTTGTPGTPPPRSPLAPPGVGSIADSTDGDFFSLSLSKPSDIFIYNTSYLAGFLGHHGGNAGLHGQGGHHR